MQPSIKDYLALHALILFSSLGGVCSKFAAQQAPFSALFIMFYGLLLFILAVYAFFWQQIIKKMTLTTAYLNKAVTVVWGIFWGVVFFHEQLTLKMMLGACVVLIGIILVVLSDE